MARPFRHPKRVRADKHGQHEVPLESSIERHLIAACQRHGFLCWKFTSPGRTGVPDRVLITPAGTVFVELKRPGGTLRTKQEVVVAAMRRAGGTVYTLDSLAAVDALVKQLLLASKEASLDRLKDLRTAGAVPSRSASHPKSTVRERITE